jgi:hypothetical protein
MKKNMGNNDRVLRLVIAAVFTALYFQGVVEGVPGIIMLAVAGIFVATSIFGFCPLYTLLRITTARKK